MDMLEASLARTLTFTRALEDADKAANGALLAAQAVQPLERGGENTGTDLHALHALLISVRAKLCEQSRASAAQHGWQVATYEIAEQVRKTPTPDDPIVWLTGNSMMPPLREYANSEQIWQVATDEGVWTAYAEALEARLGELDIYMACPDYDNALYAVDLRRWEAVEPDDDSDAESLQGEWQRREDQ